MNNKINILSIGALVIANAAQSETLTAKLTKDQQPLVNATVAIPQLNRTTTTDETGRFKFENLDFGSYLLDVHASTPNHYNTNVEFQTESVISIELEDLDYEEIVVTANPLEHTVLKMTTPAAVISEEDLVMDRSVSMEQTLNKVPGVNSGSFGGGAGQVVIRGQQGPRVSILNNNISLQDASNVSPDHWISTETLLAKQIEVLKGPATLLYGGGAVGGVVNVIDNIIPSEQIDGLHGGVEFRLSDSALGERAGVMALEAGLTDRLMGHFSYFDLSTDDYEIPSGPESEILHDAEGHDEHEESEYDDILENTFVNSHGYNTGLSYITDNGFWGLSYSDLSRNYGIPGHSHEEEEQDDGHDEENHEGGVSIDLEKSVFNIKGKHEFGENNLFRMLKAFYTSTDYQHAEIEGDEIGTVFKNDGSELRLELTHKSIAGFSGVWGLQSSNRKFSAIGDEAYILPSETQINSLFLIEENDFNNWHGEFGLRYEKQSIVTDRYADIDDSAFSVSLGATLSLNDNWTLPVNLTSAQRLPTAEELFSNQSGAEELIPHAATGTIEIGNPDLDSETANNFDIGLRYRTDNFSANLAVFYNRIDDYIFLQSTGNNVDEIPVFIYQQQQATFKGFEADMAYNYSDSFGNNWNFRLFSDKTTAELDNGENVPRIPPVRVGLDIGWLKGDWAANLGYTHASKQDKVAEFELPTASYNLMTFNINRVFSSDSFDTMVFLKADNLLNEEIREHASFIKDIAPRPGRSLSAGIRLTF